MNQRTPLRDATEKVDIIEHINGEHQAELMAIMADYLDDAEHANPLIEDIFEEGCLVLATQNSKRDSFFIPFQIKGNIEEKVLYLAYSAMVKQGKPMGGGQKRYFEVLQTQYISPNMLRLVLKTAQGLPENAPGFAFLYTQKILPKMPKISEKSTSSGKMNRYMASFLLWLMKILSGKQRRKMVAKMNAGMRYYTVREVKKSHAQMPFADIAHVDIYLHGNTSGSLWAKKIQVGDVIYSSKEYTENTAHLHQGKALLLADETALPTLANLLELWQNPQLPIVIIITAKAEDQDYLPDQRLPENIQCRRFVGAQSTHIEAILAYLKAQERIDTAWGAMEDKTAKAVRTYLRQERGLDGKHNKVKAYWRA